MKIKHFCYTDKIPEDKINEFIKDVDVIDIKYMNNKVFSENTYIVAIMYTDKEGECCDSQDEDYDYQTEKLESLKDTFKEWMEENDVGSAELVCLNLLFISHIFAVNQYSKEQIREILQYMEEKTEKLKKDYENEGK